MPAHAKPLPPFDIRAASGAAGRSSATVEGSVVLLVVLLMPIGLYLAGSAGHARLLYPALNMLLAGILFARGSPWYLAHCLLAFCFVSLVRRLADLQAGWDPSNPILLTPYLCCSFAAFSLVEYWWRRAPQRLGPFLVIFFAIAYGTVLAVLYGRVLASFVDAMKWSVGPLMAVYLLANRERLASIRRTLEPTLVWAATAMALYGVVQFVQPPLWDALWMREIAELGLDSIGQPEPFSVRVFSTMNSPGSLALIISAAIIVALKRNAFSAAVTITLMVVGLALSQYRSIWAATMLAFLLVMLSSRNVLRPTTLVALAAVGLGLGSTTLIPRVHEAIIQRAHSLASLKDDESLASRLSQYAALGRADDLVAGEGLAINGASRRLDRELPTAIDGALIEIWRGMGVIVGSAFLAAMSVLVASLFRSVPASANEVVFDRAIALGTFILMPMGSVHTGELGFCAWVFLGFGLATLLRTQPEAAASRPAPLLPARSRAIERELVR